MKLKRNSQSRREELTFAEFVDKMNNILKEHPEAANYKVITLAGDDYFYEIKRSLPLIGHADANEDCFLFDEEFEYDNYTPINAVLIN